MRSWGEPLISTWWKHILYNPFPLLFLRRTKQIHTKQPFLKWIYQAQGRRLNQPVVLHWPSHLKTCTCTRSEVDLFIKGKCWLYREAMFFIYHYHSHIRSFTPFQNEKNILTAYWMVHITVCLYISDRLTTHCTFCLQSFTSRHVILFLRTLSNAHTLPHLHLS